MKIFAFILLILSACQVFADDLFKDTKGSCVAWKASKRMFLVNHVRPVGVQCGVKLQREMADNNSFRFRMDLPVTEFNSGEPERDAEVAVILGGKEKKALVVYSKVFSSDTDLDTFLRGSPKNAEVFLRIAEKEYPIAVTLDRSANPEYFVGHARTTFQDLGLAAPTIAGGVVAKVSQELELHFRIHKSEIK